MIISLVLELAALLNFVAKNILFKAPNKKTIQVEDYDISVNQLYQTKSDLNDKE